MGSVRAKTFWGHEPFKLVSHVA